MKQNIIRGRLRSIKMSVGILCLMNLFFACKDVRLHNMVDDTVYLLKSGYVEEEVNIWEKSTCDLYVIKSGVGQLSLDLKLLIDERILTEYNETNSTSYKMLPKELYSVNTTNLTFSKEAYRDKFTFELNIQGIRDLQESSGDSYVIPCQIVPENTSFVFSDKSKSISLINPIIRSPYVGFSLESDSIGMSPQGDEKVDYYIEIQRNYPCENNLSLEIVADESLVDAYNLAHGTSFRILPQPVLDNVGKQFTVVIESIYDKTTMRIQFSKQSFLAGGEYLFGNYILPLRINKVSENGINPQKSLFILKVSFNENVLKRNPLARWATYNLSGVNIFAEGDEKIAPGSFFQFGRNVAFPATGFLNIETGVTSPADSKAWGTSILYPTDLANRGKSNWFSDVADDLDTWAKVINQTMTAAGAPQSYLGNNGGDPCPKGWHIPTSQEARALMYDRFVFGADIDKTDVEETDIDLYGENKSLTYKADYKKMDATTVVAYRFKETADATAFRYKLVDYATITAHIEVRAKVIAGSSIDEIMGWGESDWVSEDVVVRYFPITGYRLHYNSMTEQKTDNQGKEFYLWINNPFKSTDANANRATTISFVGWNVNNKLFAGENPVARAMAVPCRCIKNKE